VGFTLASVDLQAKQTRRLRFARLRSIRRRVLDPKARPPWYATTLNSSALFHCKRSAAFLQA